MGRYIASTFRVGNPGDRIVSEQREEAVRAGVARGQSDPELALVMGVSSRTVSRIRKRLGLDSGWAR